MIHIQCWQVHDDALLRSRGTTVDIGYAARETEPDWPLIRHNILHVIIKYAINFFPSKKGWLKTLNLQQLNGKIRKMAKLWIIIEYLAKGVSRAMLLWWFAGQNSDTNSGLWICNRGNKPMIAFQQAPNRQKDPPETYYLFVWAGWQILKTQQSIPVPSRRAVASELKIAYLTHDIYIRCKDHSR